MKKRIVIEDVEGTMGYFVQGFRYHEAIGALQIYIANLTKKALNETTETIPNQEATDEANNN